MPMSAPCAWPGRVRVCEIPSRHPGSGPNTRACWVRSRFYEGKEPPPRAPGALWCLHPDHAMAAAVLSQGSFALAWPGVTVLALVLLFAVYAFMGAGFQAMQAFGSVTAGPVFGHLRASGCSQRRSVRLAKLLDELVGLGGSSLGEGTWLLRQARHQQDRAAEPTPGAGNRG